MSEDKANTPEDVLSDEILSDAKRRADRTVKRAEREGKKLVDRAVKQAETVRDRALETSNARLAREKGVFASGLALEERMRRLKAQGALLDEVFDRAAERLKDRDGVNTAAVVLKLAVEGVLAMTGDAFVLRLNAKDLEAMGSTLPGEVIAGVRQAGGRDVTIAASADDAVDGGVLIESADGRQRVDNTFAGRLRRLKKDLRFEIAGLLFEDVSSPEPAKDGES